MDDLNDLYLFARVVEAGGFSAAERQTGVPKSRLSRRVAALEARLGVRLLQRTARRFHVTEAGERVYGHARRMADEAAAARAAADELRAEPSGLLRVSASSLTGELLLAGWLAEFAARHPKLRVSLGVTNRYVDLLAERVDLAVRFASRPLPSADLVARPLGRARMVLVASPALVEARGEPADVDALGEWPTLAQGEPGSVRPWAFRGDDGREIAFHPRARFVSDSYVALREAALRGAGAAQLPLEACREALGRGALRALLARREPAGTPVYAIYPSRRGVRPAVRMLVDFLAARYGGGG